MNELDFGLERKPKLSLECAGACLIVDLSERRRVQNVRHLIQTDGIGLLRMIQNVRCVDSNSNRLRFRNPEGLAHVAIQSASGNGSHRVVTHVPLMAWKRVLEHRYDKEVGIVRLYRSSSTGGYNQTQTIQGAVRGEVKAGNGIWPLQNG